MYEKIKNHVESLKPDIIELTRELIRIPSPIGEEKDIVDLIKNYLLKLEYDDVFVDEIGNIVGIMKSSGESSSIIYNSHLDHYEIKAKNNWVHGPFNANVIDDVIYGCGASDSKGSIACQIYAGYILKKMGILKGDYIFTGVVKEGAVGCFGIRYLCDTTLKDILEKVSLIVLGNATNLDIYLGHRGRVEFEITTYGRTCYSNVPQLGINAIHRIVPFIQDLHDLIKILPSHPFLGKTTLAITSINSMPQGENKVPDRCLLSVDRYFLPAETLKEVIGQLQAIIDKNSAIEPTFKSTVKIKTNIETSYTGYTQEVPRLLLPFLMDAQLSLIQKVKAALNTINQNTHFGSWNFPTDGSYTAGVLGIPTIGYSPGAERYIGTPFDCVEIDALIKATMGYAAIHYYLTHSGEEL